MIRTEKSYVGLLFFLRHGVHVDRLLTGLPGRAYR